MKNSFIYGALLIGAGVYTLVNHPQLNFMYFVFFVIGAVFFMDALATATEKTFPQEMPSESDWNNPKEESA